MSKRLAIALCLAAASSACVTEGSQSARPDYSAMGPSMNARRYASLQKLASRDLNCPVERLQHEYLGENQHVMRGCETNGLYELRCMMGSCVWIPDLRARAAFDLGCARTEIKVSVIGPSTRGAAGCGKRATYQMSPVDGSWILNSPVIADQAPISNETGKTTDL